MGRIVKVFIAVIAVLIVLTAGAALLLPALIPSSVYQKQLEARVESALGRRATFAGPIKLNTFPKLSIRAQDVTIANADGFTDPYFAKLDRLDVQVGLLPLLGRRIDVKAFVLEGAALRLETKADGSSNYVFTPAGGAARDAAPASSAAGASTPAAGAPNVHGDLSLGDVRLVDAAVTYRDGATGEVYDITGLNADARLTSLTKPAQVEGRLRFKDVDFTYLLKVGEPLALIEGRTAAIEAAFDSALVAASTQVNLTTRPNLAVVGRAAVRTPSIRKLAAWAGSPLPEGGGLEEFALSGELDLSETKAGFTQASLRLDGLKGAGDLVIDLAAERPRVTGRLELSDLDLRPYAPAPVEPAEGGSAADGAGDRGEAAGASSGVPPWSEEPIDLSPLTLVDADLSLKTQRILLPTLTVDASEIRARLSNGVLDAELARLDLYEGRAVGALRVDAGAQTPTYRVTLDAQGFELLPLLAESASFERLSGTAQADLDISARGASPKAIASSLNGRAAVIAADGGIIGLNLPLLFRTAQSLTNNPASTLQSFLSGGADLTGADTDFSDLDVVLAFDRGVAQVETMRLLNPYARVIGEGRIDFGGQSIDLYLRPYFGERATGNVQDDDFKESPVNARVRGPWSKVSITPDASGAGRAILQGQIKSLVGEDNPVSGLVGGLLGGASGEEGAQDPVGGLVGGLLGGAQPEEGEEPPSAEGAAVGAIFGILGQAAKREREKKEEEEKKKDGGGR